MKKLMFVLICLFLWVVPAVVPALAGTAGFGMGLTSPHNGNEKWSLDEGYLRTVSYEEEILNYHWLRFDLGAAYYNLEYKSSKHPDGRHNGHSEIKLITDNLFALRWRTRLHLNDYINPFFDAEVAQDSETYYLLGPGLNIRINDILSVDFSYKEANTFHGEKAHRMSIFCVKYLIQ